MTCKTNVIWFHVVVANFIFYLFFLFFHSDVMIAAAFVLHEIIAKNKLSLASFFN